MTDFSLTPGGTLTVKTDKRVYIFDRDEQTMRVHSLLIENGKIVHSKKPVFVLDMKKEFRFHPSEKKTFLTVFKSWLGR